MARSASKLKPCGLVLDLDQLRFGLRYCARCGLPASHPRHTETSRPDQGDRSAAILGERN